MPVAVVDLFAGAGGLGIGAGWAGAEVRASVETDGDACLTLKRDSNNHHGEVIQADVQNLSGAELRAVAAPSPGERLVVGGGPPCQPFSKAAYWTENGDEARYRRARSQGVHVARPTASAALRPDGRRSLVDDFARLVIDSEADGFLFENVPSLLHPRNRPTAEGLMQKLRNNGYQLTLVRANAAEHGVPQKRQRVLILGSRETMPIPPGPTHSLADSAEARGQLLPVVTAAEALAPFAGSEFREQGEVVEGKWAQHLREIEPGWNYKWHTAWAGHPEPTFETETRFWNFLLKLSPELPSWTIAASPGPWTGPFHWDSRRLRTVEMAALQGFPDGYDFAGSRRERVRQIGNAVPPKLAERMVRSVLQTFESQEAA